MTKSYVNLIRLASKLEHKYFNKAAMDASSIKDQIQQHISMSIDNKFHLTNMVTTDETSISFDITRKDAAFTGGANITVSNLKVGKFTLFPKYQELMLKIKDYLTTNWELFITHNMGEAVDYKSGVTLNLQYSS